MSSSIYKKLLTVIGAAGAATGAIALANRLMTRSALSQDSPVSEAHYYEWRYGKVFYTRSGKGQPVLLIHGLYPGASSHTLKLLADSLADHHTVYLIDLPGFGRSDKPKLTFTAFFYVQLLGDFIENVIHMPTSVIADCESCTFCSIACQLQPQLYSRLILFNPVTVTEETIIPTEWNRFMRRILELPVLGTFIYNLATTRHHLRSVYGNLLNEEDIRLCSAAAHYQSGSGRYAYASWINHYINANISRPLSKIDTSVYVVISGDPSSAKAQMEYLHTLNSSIETEYIQGIKPFIWLQNPNAILDICQMLL